MDIMDPSLLLIITSNYGVTLMMALGGQEWRTQFRKMWRAGAMTSWLKHAPMFNKDFQPRSRYGNLWLCSVRPSIFHKQTTSHISLDLEDRLLWSGSSWNVVSGCYIPPIDKDVNQTECSMLKYSITKMAVYIKCASTLLALHCLWCLWAMLT